MRGGGAVAPGSNCKGSAEAPSADIKDTRFSTWDVRGSEADEEDRGLGVYTCGIALGTALAMP